MKKTNIIAAVMSVCLLLTGCVDSNEALARMTTYYDQNFDIVSTERPRCDDDITLWTLADAQTFYDEDETREFDFDAALLYAQEQWHKSRTAYDAG